MTTEPYGEDFYTELNRLLEARTRAAEGYAAQMLYLRLGGKYDLDTPRVKRELVAEAAAREWIQLTGEIEELQASEYRKKRLAR